MLKITEENPSELRNRSTYSFDDNRLYYSYEDFEEPELSVEKSDLTEFIPETLRERMFYGLGNSYI